ncbi:MULTISPECIES: hypothetical protein [Methylobacterium]|uniref:hypothetical protein n=1 Tax=Methylobacterium TaxID=407 RepID=UPI002F35916D
MAADLGCRGRALSGLRDRWRTRRDGTKNLHAAWLAMPGKTPAKKKPLKAEVAEKAPRKVGLPTQLAAIQTRYRNALLDAADLPRAEQGDRIRSALATLLAEKAALGVRDGEEAAEVE